MDDPLTARLAGTLVLEPFAVPGRALPATPAAPESTLRGLVREARLLQAPGATAQARPAVARQAVA